MPWDANSQNPHAPEIDGIHNLNMVPDQNFHVPITKHAIASFCMAPLHSVGHTL